MTEEHHDHVVYERLGELTASVQSCNSQIGQVHGALENMRAENKADHTALGDLVKTQEKRIDSLERWRGRVHAVGGVFGAIAAVGAGWLRFFRDGGNH